MWRQCGGHVAAMWRRCGGDVAAMWRRCGGDVAAMWRRCGGDVVAMWWQCDDHTTTTFFTILTMKGQWHDDGNILQFEISSWSYHHVAETKKVTRRHEIHGSSHLQAKRNPCSQSVTFHQRPKIVPTHRQIKTCFFDDDTALLAVLLQGRRHAAALYDWCDLKWPLWPSNAVIEWALIRFKNQARVTLGRCKSALCMCSKKEKRSDVKWVFVPGAGSIQLELCSINGLETTAVCFWQRMNSHVAKVTTWTNVVNLNSGFFDVSVHQYIPSPGRGDEFAGQCREQMVYSLFDPPPCPEMNPSCLELGVRKNMFPVYVAFETPSYTSPLCRKPLRGVLPQSRCAFGFSVPICI